MKYYAHQHSKLGSVKVLENKKARRYILKVLNGEVIVTTPPDYAVDLIDKLLDQHADEILKILQNQGDFRLKEGFTFKSDIANINILRSSLTKPTLKKEDKTLTIILSRSQDELSQHCQIILIKTIELFLKEIGSERIIKRIGHWAEMMNVEVGRVKVGNAKTSWGKCDSMRNIIISVYAVLLPDHLLDYLVIHELAHLNEMNHSNRFWAIVDQYTNNKANQLSDELKGYNTSIAQFKKGKP